MLRLVRKPFAIPRRSYFYTKNGELVSKPRRIETKELYHPVLGHYASEYLDVPSHSIESVRQKYPQSVIELQHPTNLVRDLKEHQKKQIEKSVGQGRSALLDPNSDDRLTLGQVVFVRRKLCVSSPKPSNFLGVVIEVCNRGLESYVRLRNQVMSTGVEMKVPLFSPLLVDIKILKHPSNVPHGPNLFGLREKPEKITDFIHPTALTDKGRQAVIQRVEAGQMDQLGL
jgi:ribosomal protein L19